MSKYIYIYLIYFRIIYLRESIRKKHDFTYEYVNTLKTKIEQTQRFIHDDMENNYLVQDNSQIIEVFKHTKIRKLTKI